jgi:predicted amidohydrolase
VTGSDALTVAAAQPPCASDDVVANVAAHVDAIRGAAARVVVFPELSLTGYELDAGPIDPADERLVPLVDACASTGAIALVGAPTSDGGRGDAIAVIAVDAAGARVVYRKMWLSEREAERFVPGASPAVLTIDGWRLGLAICKDTGVPAHADATAALGIDAYVAGVLDTADDAAVQEERALRITAAHRIWVVMASFAGSTGGGYGTAAGRSRIWSPDGELVANGGQATGGLARATLTRRS